ncbi:unnamed protein product [Musa acuminata subsp. burmannicoides]
MAAHVLVLPFPSQGHISPMFQFAKRLAAKGPKTTLVTTHFILNSFPSQTDSVRLAPISDGHDRGGFPSAASLEAYLLTLADVGARSLSKLIDQHAASGCPFTCMVYDTVVQWAVEVAKMHGLATAAFSTQSCAVSAIYYYVNQGMLDVPEAGGSVSCSAPFLPPLARSEFPSLALRQGRNLTVSTMAMNQFNLEKDDWVLFNSFDMLEIEVVNRLKRHWRARAIGPSVPLPLVDKEGGATYGLSLLEAEEDTCMRWLNSKPPRSVVYVSFGSVASVSAEQMEELACGLEASGKNFLWVVRAAVEKTLPRAFAKAPPERGLVVRWSPQLAVLAHPALGCFVTHCGWNSTLEAVSLGVPMVAFPLWTDQPTNAKYVEDVWEVGVRVRRAETGVVSREEIERCVRAVMDGKRSGEMMRNSRRWRDAATEALQAGGSSDEAMDEFVAFVNAEAKD